MSSKTANGRNKLSTSLVVGLLLVPLSAVAAVALVNPDATAEPEEAVAVEMIVEEVTSTTTAEAIEIPEIASDDDLAAACGEQGLALVEKEAAGTISPLEQAALDSLRAICSSEAMHLPGPPAPVAVVETVTVAAAPTGGAGSDSVSASHDGAAAEFEEAYAETVAYINAALDEGAQGEMIDLAKRLVADAGVSADAGDYEAGMAKLDAARDAADSAERGGDHHEDHDDDDDDYDDDDD